MPISNEQRKQRVKAIGSSDVPILLGVSPFKKTAYDVWMEKTGRLPVAESEEDDPASELTAGQFFEGGVLDWAQKSLGYLHRNVKLAAADFHLHCNVDALTFETAEPVEAKTSGFLGPVYGEWGDEGTDQVPEHVIAQAHAHLLTLPEAQICHIPVFIQGRGFLMFRVNRDKELCEIIAEACLDFWVNHVEKDIPPENSAPSLAVVRRIRREPNKVVAVDAGSLLAWRSIRDEAKCWEQNKKGADAQLIAMLGDAECGTCDVGHVTFYEQSREGIDTKRLRAERPDIWKEYQTETKFRVLRFKERKEENGAIEDKRQGNNRTEQKRLAGPDGLDEVVGGGCPAEAFNPGARVEDGIGIFLPQSETV